ncbi:hypothetical protein DTO013E5_6987 [Penicillium roqueforti]|uniref:uncharacterized protein n=1 Tax=Penicillium roqueforti TaxID=5082 RepID=UPI00190C822B|nr:uncharacterized protein LCP9604111_8343 [Penicillium roqueforti]KAF9241734.1 hypothetical protein LCP9604111_8343 [Penicillium roqueforti]KAI2673007.1 hypothetical protein CBS147355_7810 [Penicillium roqueforti]KAI2674285.1 hypothetical protein LCP963914a_8901 [Penicillium roqueforti]KAI2703247.1 hypothetical protein CBS147372_3562 [Penicillium roqueforti]KAI2720362.1 hypothetical protein CBS147318_3668 [Penicillium roqueforti]
MVLMSHAVQRSIEDITMLTAYQLLACACYGPIGSALAHKYGKRPQFIFATIMGFIGTLGELSKGLAPRSLGVLLLQSWEICVSFTSDLSGLVC